MISQDKEKRLEYEAREKALRDYNQSMKEARETGRMEGEREGKFKVAKNMLLKNLDISIIAECTGLSEKEIKALKEI